MKKEKEIYYNSFYNQFLMEVPKFQSVYDEHIDDNNKLLEHILTGDLTRYVVKLFIESENDDTKSDHNMDIIDRILAFLERAMISTDESVRNVVSVSFLENLVKHEEEYIKLKKLLGPNLCKEVRYYE